MARAGCSTSPPRTGWTSMSPDAAGSGETAENPGPLSLSAVEALLASGFWVRLEGAGPTGSTNDDARALAASGAPEGTAVLASSQSSGRGRFSRRWESPAGGVYISAVLRPPNLTASQAALPLAIGLGVADGLASLGASPSLKWPNDVLLDGSKVAGVLVEARGSGRSDTGESNPDAWVIAGIGVNVLRPAADDAPPGAGFLADVLRDVTREAVAAAVLDGIASAYRRFTRDGFAALRREYVRICSTLGSDVRVSDAEGKAVAEGTAVDVDGSGRLVLQTASGIVAVSSGEVTLQESRVQG